MADPQGKPTDPNQSIPIAPVGDTQRPNVPATPPPVSTPPPISGVDDLEEQVEELTDVLEKQTKELEKIQSDLAEVNRLLEMSREGLENYTNKQSEEYGYALQSHEEYYQKANQLRQREIELSQQIQDLREDETTETQLAFRNLTENLIESNNQLRVVRGEEVSSDMENLFDQMRTLGFDEATLESLPEETQLVFLKGINAGIENLFNASNLSAEEQQRLFSEMMQNEESRDQITGTIFRSILEEAAASNQSLEEMETINAVLKNMQKNWKDSQRLLGILVTSQLKLAEEQRKQMILEAEAAKEQEDKPLAVYITNPEDTKEDSGSFIGMLIKGLLKFLIFGALAVVLGTIAAVYWIRFTTWFSSIVTIVKGAYSLARRVIPYVDDIHRAIVGIGNAIPEIAIFLVAKMKSVISSLLETKVGKIFGGVINKVQSMFSGTSVSIVSKVKNFISPIVEMVMKIYEFMKPALKFIEPLYPYLKWIFKALTGFGLFENVIKAFKWAFGFLRGIPFIGYIINGIFALIDIIKTFNALAGSGDTLLRKLIKGILVAAINFFTLGFLDFKKVLEFVNNLFIDFGGTITKLFDDIVEWFMSDGSNQIMEWVIWIFNKAWDFTLGTLKMVFYTIPKLIFYDLLWKRILVPVGDFLLQIVKDIPGELLAFITYGLPNILKGVVWDIPLWIGMKIGEFLVEYGPTFLRKLGDMVWGMIKWLFGTAIPAALKFTFYTLPKAILFDIPVMILKAIKAVLFDLPILILTSVQHFLIGMGPKILDFMKWLGEKIFIDLPMWIGEKLTKFFTDIMDLLADTSVGKLLGIEKSAGKREEEALAASAEVQNSFASRTYGNLSDLLSSGKAYDLSDQELSKVISDGNRALSQAEGPQLKSVLENALGRLSAIQSNRQGKIGKATTTNIVQSATTQYTEAKEEKETAMMKSSQPLINNNTTMMNQSSSTTKVVSAPSRFNSEPTFRGIQMAALPGVV